MAGKIIIDAERCKGCMLCVAVCPKGCIVTSKKSNKNGYFPAESSNIDCTGCAACAIICPDAAIVVFRDESEKEKKKHNERCPRCKQTIKMMLEKIYNKVEVNYKVKIGTHPEDFQNSLYYNNIKEIYETLQNHRGFNDFVKAKTLPNCDFFLPNPGLIVEFDESQHFTLPRKIALEHYPEKYPLGFDRNKWIELCRTLNDRDNDPPYRDEQRAWYDTFRDFLPTIKGLKPTIRLFASDLAWCSLDPNNPSDVNRFENILKRNSKNV